MQIEVCAYSFDSCLTAQRAGADRIELCGGLSEGGTTPSAGLIQLARQQLSIQLFVMIRPRGGDFLYSATELDVMRTDIAVAKSLGADGVVFGILQADGTVDEVTTKELVDLAYPMQVTFHRAFDMTHDPVEALEAVIRTGAIRILTSGQHPSAELGVAVLRQLAEQSAGRIEIMAGVGVSGRNAGQFTTIGLDALHLSGKSSQPSPMIYRRPSLQMASAILGEYERIEASANAIQRVVEQVKP
ncbi:copper homeostasis protein CutC [Spirosoma agri]|uniref:PF03932 family protein CutC n=1 Tax=Spirosoma agri TaxID=1987381 RepID=A0A6M0IKJ4_9BACT|nr:copper homeostasis protein CutC [Spirosoma agri]NEU68684.1 copper homeostasis protein CutC [Spirosoma agri]